jgi:glutamate synthase (NADPH) small chain
MTLRTSTSHEEGVNRNWGILTKAFISDENGNVKSLRLVDIEWKYDKNNNYKPYFEEVPGTERDIPCDLVLLAIGFKHVQPEGIIKAMNLELSDQGNVQADEKSYQTSEESVFAAGDARRGQSLVVWAISEGREVARSVDTWLMGQSMLESKDENPALAAR